jgi:hypothetical protein
MMAKNIGGAAQRLLVAFTAIALAAGCNAEAKDQAKDAEREALPEVGSTPEGREGLGNTAGTDGANDRPDFKVTESDRLSLDMARQACRANDFKTFFQAYARSWLVRENYTAETVRFGEEGNTRDKSRRNYVDGQLFPIGILDNGWVTAETMRQFDADPEFNWRNSRYMELEFNTASDNRQRVDYQAGIFERNLDPPPPELEEGLGAMIEPIGPGGYLLFYPTDTCWELVQDASNPVPRR